MKIPFDIMKPEFKIRNNGRVYCKSHSKYHLLEEKPPILTDSASYRANTEFLKERLDAKTCRHCNHYLDDNCTIPKKELDKYMLKLRLKRFKCEFCGASIHHLYNIIYKNTVEANYEVKIPLLCCRCFEIFKNKSFREAGKFQLRHFCITHFVFLIPLIVILSLVTFIVGADLSMLLVILIPIILVTIFPFIVDYKSGKKLKKSLKKSEILKKLFE